MNDLLKFITCGSVDDGKSTLIGHILYDSKLLYADQEKALVLDSKVGSRGGEIDYSLLLDGLMAEREQGITIDVAYRYFTTDKRSFIVADTPGHEEYTRNMAVGASFADLSVILIDATQGVLVQTRRHARICKLMGIRYFVFAVNKMDLASYSEETFNNITSQIEKLSNELKLENVKIIPVSATAGDNVTTKSDNMPWYKDEPLLEYLENVEIKEPESDNEFCMPVQRVCRPDHNFRGFQGQIEGGKIAVGDVIKTLPSEEEATVKSIIVGFDEVKSASLGQPVNIQLSKEVDVSRGCVLVSKDSKIKASKGIKSTVLWMDDDELTLGKEYILKLGTKHIPATVKNIEYKIDVNSGKHIDDTKLVKNEIAYCEIEFAEKIIAQKFNDNKALGGFILIDRVSHMTCACGVVEELESNIDKKPYFTNGEINIDGFVFEEFYFNLENAFLKKQESDVTYKVGDKVNVEGESFKYPDYFDIVSPESNAAVLVRNKQIEDIISLDDYSYSGLPVTDVRGFALKIKSNADLQNFIYEFNHIENDKTAAFYNKWSKFETYRRIVCSDNFWII